MKKKIIHFVGIKGVGMTPLAIIAKEAGFEVTGCDINEEFITDVALKKAGITPEVGFSKDHIENVDLIITTGAHGGYDNKEVKAASQLKKKILTQGEALGEYMSGAFLGRELRGISVTGSHGKTTTTAMIATVFTKAGQDPSYSIGTGSVLSLGLPGHYGKGNYFIAEADEYATEPVYDKTPKFLWQHPHIAVFTNIELDHPDLYVSLNKVREAFLSFAHNIPKNGVLIVNGDDNEIQKMLKSYTGRVITFGKNATNEVSITKFTAKEESIRFTITRAGKDLGEFAVPVIGEHNAYNATAAIITSLEAGIEKSVIQNAIAQFKGSKRRAQYIGHLPSGALVFDDYAHHPTEIRSTLSAFKAAYPEKKIICIFQPHTYSRTKKLFDDFKYSFSKADTVIINTIYASLREAADSTVSAEKLVEAIGEIHSNSLFMSTRADVVKYIDKNNFDKNTLILIMGAGDIYRIFDELPIQL